MGNYARTTHKADQPVAFSSAAWYDIIGIARDGHVIIGPYKADGTTWQCNDRDACNGTFINGQYVYVGSDQFPYVVGCWGPAPESTYMPSCTTNGCGTAVAPDSSLISAQIGILASAIAISSLVLM